jgi:hypothetical protein
LRDNGMATTERFGTTMMYSLSDKRVIEALDLMRLVMTDNLKQKTALVRMIANGD